MCSICHVGATGWGSIKVTFVVHHHSGRYCRHCCCCAVDSIVVVVFAICDDDSGVEWTAPVAGLFEKAFVFVKLNLVGIVFCVEVFRILIRTSVGRTLM